MDRSLLSAVVLSAAVLAACAGCSRRAEPKPSGASLAASVPADGGLSWVKMDAKGDTVGAAIKAEVAKAKARGLKPIVYIGAVWCKPCQAVKAARKDPLMVEALKGAHVMEFDADEYESDELENLGFRAHLIPAIQHVNAEGRPVGRVIDDDAWGDDTPAEMAPVFKQFVATAP